MDELVIGEKKYVSSKRAAELTGYAKDYIGQLCREGRVEARLVGRSWYVLETSVLEHRFGAIEKEAPAVEESTQEDAQVPQWDSPIYTTEEIAPLPELKPELKIERPSLPSHINLLSKVPSTFMPLPEVQEEASVAAEQIEEITAPVEKIVEEERPEGEVVAVHRISSAPLYEEEIQGPIPPVPTRRAVRKRKGSLISSAVVVAVAVLALVVIVFGTGITEGNALLSGKNSSFVDFLGGKSFYSR